MADITEQSTEEVNAEVSTDNQAGVEGKDTNRTFTQSEHDARIAEALKKTESKYSDYAETKQRLEELQKIEDERKQAEMTEVEKLTAQLNEANQASEGLQTQLKQQEILNLKNEVLSAEDYIKLPSIYRQSVAGETLEELNDSAKQITEQWKKDFGITGDSTPTPPLGNRGSDKTAIPKNSKEAMQALIQQKLGG